jgi:hypothetical protein
MRRIEMMTAGGVTLGGLGVLVGLAIGSGTGTPKVVAQRAQPIEVRTEVIRKTVNVYKRAKPQHVAAAGPGGKRAGSGSSAVYGTGSAAPTTRTSGLKSAGTGSYAAAPVVSTRTSGAKSTSGSSSQGSGSQGSGSGTVKTRTSGGAASGGGSGSAKPVSTRSSGGGGSDNGGGHDD